MPRALLLALCLLVAAHPVAAAPGAGPVEGSLEFTGPVRLSGEVAVSSPEGLLNLTALAREGRAPELRAASVQGWAVTRNWTTARGPQGPVSLAPEFPQNASIAHGPARIRGLACGEGCLVAAFGLGGDGTRVGATGALGAPLAWLSEPERYWAESSGRDAANAFLLELPPGTFALEPKGGALLAEGRVGLFARSAILVIEEGNATRVVDTRTQRLDAADPLGVASAARVRSGFVYLELEGAAIHARAPGPAPLRFRQGTMDFAGIFDAASATGALRAGRATLRLHEDAVRLEGAFSLVLEPMDFPSGDVARLGAADPPTLRGHVRGEAVEVSLAGARAFAGASPPASFWAHLASLALLAVATLQRSLHLGLYTRIARSAVLDHPRRRLVLDAVRASPGATAAEVARTLSMGRVLTQYHLRMLMTNALVVPRSDGRQTRWFVPEAAPAPEEVAIAHALGEETRRRIAAHVLAAPRTGVTQRDLARLASVSPRLVSYHLARLQAPGLVRSVGGRPQRFVATPLLAEELDNGNATQANDIAP